MMTWTIDQKIEHLLTLPWTVVVTEEDGEFAARVTELQGVLATGATERELHVDLAESIESVLAAMLEFGDPIPLPRGRQLPWEQGAEPPQVITPDVIVIDRSAMRDLRTASSAVTAVFAHA